MPAIRRTSARTVSRTLTRRLNSTIQVELRFRSISVQGGNAVSFDVEVHPGTAVEMAIHASPVTTANTVERTFLGPQTQYFRGVRVDSECPEFVFYDAQGAHIGAMIHLGSGRPEVIEGDTENIRVR